MAVIPDVSVQLY